VQQDLDSESRDEGKITLVGVEGKDSLHSSSSSNDESPIDEQRGMIYFIYKMYLNILI
jgi:hypothetical protein